MGLLGGVELHDSLVRGGGLAGDETLFLQNGGLPGYVTLVDADDLGEFILRDARLGADFREVTGVAGF